jgi:hypothetical protein
LNESGIPPFFYDNRATIRNVVFLLLVFLFQFLLGHYLLSQAGLYMEQRSDIPQNSLLGLFLFLIFILDLVIFLVKCRELRYIYLTNIEFFKEENSFLGKVRTKLIAVSAFFSIIPNIFFQLMVTNSTGNYFLGMLMTIGAFVKWGIVIWKIYWITKDKRKGEVPEPPPLALQFWTDALLTLTSSVIFTVVWRN